MSALTEWLNKYYGFIVLGIIIGLLLFWNLLMRFLRKLRSKPKDAALPPPPLLGVDSSLFSLEQESLFDDLKGQDTFDNFQEQKVMAEKQIKQIKEDGKRLVREALEFDQEYRQRKLKFDRDRKHLGMKYTVWVNQLRMIDEMITNQARINEEFKKMKEAGSL